LDKAPADDLEVVVLVEIGTDGRATRATIDRSSGNPTIDEQALSAARRAQFKPYVKDGVARPIKAKFPFIFKKP
jgi:protein TonB